MSELEEYYEQEDKEKGVRSAWMITFADLLSLMLTFFVLLYSMSVITQADWEELVKSMQQRLNPEREITELTFSEELTAPQTVKKPAMDLDYLYGVIREKLDKTTAGREVALERLDDRVVISLASDLLFRSGSAALSPKGEMTMLAVSDVVGILSNKIDVTGHTDPNPIASADYPSNWELSLARAGRVAAGIYASGYGGVVDVYGLADSRFDEISTEYPTSRRYGLARRVDVVIRSTLP